MITTQVAAAGIVIKDISPERQEELDHVCGRLDRLGTFFDPEILRAAGVESIGERHPYHCRNIPCFRQDPHDPQSPKNIHYNLEGIKRLIQYLRQTYPELGIYIHER
jgi:hypothetical protein